MPTAASDSERGRDVGSYLKWVYTSGQRIAQGQGYATLPADVLAKVAAKASTVR